MKRQRKSPGWHYVVTAGGHKRGKGWGNKPFVTPAPATAKPQPYGAQFAKKPLPRKRKASFAEVAAWLGMLLVAGAFLMLLAKQMLALAVIVLAVFLTLAWVELSRFRRG